MDVRNYYDNEDDNGQLICPECKSNEVDGYKWLPPQDNSIAKFQGWWNRCCDCGAWFPQRQGCTFTDVPS